MDHILMSNLLTAYLALEKEIKMIRVIEDEEDILKIMDQIWYKLNEADKNWLNERGEL